MPSLPSLVTFAQFLATCGSFPVLLILGYLVAVPVCECFNRRKV